MEFFTETHGSFIILSRAQGDEFLKNKGLKLLFRGGLLTPSANTPQTFEPQPCWCGLQEM